MQLTRPESHTTVYVEFIKYDAPKKRCCGSHLNSALRRKGCAAVRGNSVCVIQCSSCRCCFFRRPIVMRAFNGLALWITHSFSSGIQTSATGC